MLEVKTGVWPPKEYGPLLANTYKNLAWYQGNKAELNNYYTYQQRTVRGNPNFLYRASRGLWGNAGTQVLLEEALHTPIAADISEHAAEAVFGEFPKIFVSDEQTQEQLDALTEYLPEQARFAQEQCSALGGVFIRIGWETRFGKPQAYLSFHGADEALPHFSSTGRLIGATFWWTLERPHDRKTNEVWRHIEQHYQDDNGVGVIRHMLAVGTHTSITRFEPLDSHPETAHIQVNDDGVVSTESPGLSVVYIPNRQAKQLFNDPIGRFAGSSDYEGGEDAMNVADLVFTQNAWEIRNLKPRLVVNRTALDFHVEESGAGMDAKFDAARNVFFNTDDLLMPLDALQGGEKPPLEVVQFNLRVAEYEKAFEAACKQAYKAAGFSPASFGIKEEGTAITATQVRAHEKKTAMKRAASISIWMPRLAEALHKLLLVERWVCKNTAVTPELPTVQFPDNIQETPLEQMEFLAAAKANGVVTEDLEVALFLRSVGMEGKQDEYKQQLQAEKLKKAAQFQNTFSVEESASEDDEETAVSKGGV